MLLKCHRQISTKSAKAIRRAIFAARNLGPTFIHVYTSCNIEYSIPTPDVFRDAKEMEKGRFAFEEYMTDEAKELFAQIESKKKREVS